MAETDQWDGGSAECNCPEVERLKKDLDEAREQQMSAVSGMLRAEVEVERLRGVVAAYERDRLASLGGIGSPQ